MTRTLRILVTAGVAALIATAGLLAVDKVANDKLIAARAVAEGKVTADKRELEGLTVRVTAERQDVSRLATVVVPMKREMYLTAPIHSGDSFAGMVGANGFIGGPFAVRMVPDAEAAAKLSKDRIMAASRLERDEVAVKALEAKLAKEQMVAAKLAKEPVRWRYAFGVNE